MSPSDWPIETLEQCLDPVKFPSAVKLQTKDYHAEGTYPIIDQGQSLIAGWTDNQQAVISLPLPVIVFGDHTRIFKFIDFPFARGADGTQILIPRRDIDPLYFFYACRALDLPSRGYNRHFTILKEKTISLPPPSEQAKIGIVLRRIEDAVEVQDRQLFTTEKLKHAAMQQIFTCGLHDKAQNQSEIGLIPDSWEIDRLGSHYTVMSGGTPSRADLENWTDGTIPWVKTTEVDYTVIISTQEHITPKGLQNSAAKMLPPGTLLMAMYGQGVTRGRVGILGIEAACNQACAAMNSKDTAIDPQYLFYFLTYRYDEIRRLAHGGQQQNLNLEIVRDILVTFPKDVSEQHGIANILAGLDKKIDPHKRKITILGELFNALLHKLMTGEIHVADIDLSALQLRTSAKAVA